MATSDRPQGRKRSFRTWRRSRPFWGGVLTLLAAMELYGTTASPIGMVAMQAIAPASAMVIGLVLIILIATSWYQPQLRNITGPTVIVLSLASLMLVNLGGFLIGMLLGVFGGSMIFAWSPAVADGTGDAPKAADTDEHTGAPVDGAPTDGGTTPAGDDITRAMPVPSDPEPGPDAAGPGTVNGAERTGTQPVA